MNNFKEDLKWFHYSETEEYNLTIQQVIEIKNSGKYYKANEFKGTWYLENKSGELNLILIDGNEEDLYSDIRELYMLRFIVNSKYKEVQYQC